jgi:hypothetical protein
MFLLLRIGNNSRNGLGFIAHLLLLIALLTFFLPPLWLHARLATWESSGPAAESQASFPLLDNEFRDSLPPVHNEALPVNSWDSDPPVVAPVPLLSPPRQARESFFGKNSPPELSRAILGDPPRAPPRFP